MSNSKHLELTPEENQSPPRVGVIRDLIASTIEAAVDATEDLYHFWMSTPPHCLNIGKSRHKAHVILLKEITKHNDKYLLNFFHWSPADFGIQEIKNLPRDPYQQSAKVNICKLVKSVSNHIFTWVVEWTPQIIMFDTLS
jgi:hypothetical protein